MPTAPTALNATTPPPPAAKTAAPAKSGGTDFRQALAASPANTNPAKTATVPAATVPAATVPAAAVPTAALPVTAQPAAAAILPKSQNALKNAASPADAAARRGKKPLAQTTATATSVAAAPNPVLAAAAIATPAIATTASKTALPSATAAAAEPAAATATGASAQQTALDAALRKLDPAISGDGKTGLPAATAKNATAEPAKTGTATAKIATPAEPAKIAKPAAPAKTTAVEVPNIQLGAPAANAAHLAAAPAKTAEITRQLAAALPTGSLASTKPGPVIHVALNPQTLGSIAVKVTQHASGATTVTMSASQPETLAALKHDAANLNQLLTNAGVPEANRQVDFQTMPVAAAQNSSGLGNAGGQPAGGQPAGGQPAGGQPAGGQLGSQLGGGQFGGGQQQQQSGATFAGTAFASSASGPASAANPATQPRLQQARLGVDVIA